MKLLTIREGDEYRLGVMTEKGVLDVQNAARHFAQAVSCTMEELINSGAVGFREVQELVKRAETEQVQSLFLPSERIEFGPCITKPEKILCVGLNYRRHAEEAKMPLPTSPVLFSKFNNTLAAHGATIKIPPVAKKVDYEVELVIIIGKTTRNVTEEEALSYVFGYATGNDLSCRDLQFRSSQWLLGKTCDGFAPIGPYIVTADEVPNPQELHLECCVNGERRQSSNTKDMIFSCATLISYISQHITLKPGDLIFTGTPEGVIMGYPQEKQVWLQAGDEVTAMVEGLGELHVLFA